MSPKYITHTEAIEKMRAEGDLWGVVRLKLREHEMVVQEGNRAAMFSSRNELLKAIADYARKP